MKRFGIAALALILTVGVGASPVHAANNDTAVNKGGVRIEATFNDPYKTGSHAADNNVAHEFVRLTNSVPNGSWLRASIHRLDSSTNMGGIVVDALSNAQDRGAVVRVLQPANLVDPSLKSVLGTNLRSCQNLVSGSTTIRNNACLSNHQDASNHMKVALFSSAKDKTGESHYNVIWISSANFEASSGSSTYNNSLTIYGDKDLYDQFLRGTWDKMWDNNFSTSDFYEYATSGYYDSAVASTTLYVSPEGTSGGDILAGRLTPFIGGSACEVTVQHIQYERAAVAEEIARLKATGCDVKVITFKAPSLASNRVQSDYYSPTARSLMAGATQDRCSRIHDKTILVKTKTSATGNYRYFVLAGSHNANWTSNARYDDLLIKIESEGLYNAYKAHSQDAIANSSNSSNYANCNFVAP